MSKVYIYVRPTGSDWNPGTQAMPVQSFRRALSLLPKGYFEKCRIVMAPGTYVEKDPINCFLPKPVGPNAIDFAIVGEMHNVLPRDGTCTASDPGGLTYADSTLPPVTPDSLVGATLYCVSGANKGASRTVISNTGTAFSVNIPWQHAPGTCEVFQVQQPAVTVRHSGIHFWGPGAVVGLQYVKFEGADSSAGFGAAFLVKFAAESVEMALGGGRFELLHFCGIIPGTDSATYLPLSSFSTQRQADWYIHDGQFTLTDRCQVSNTTNPVTRNLSIVCADACTLAINSIFGKYTDISLSTYCTFNHAGMAAHPSSLEFSNGTNTFLIKADKNSIVGGGKAGLQHLTLEKSSGDAIVVQENSHAYIGSVTGTNSASGSVGIRCESMSTARVHQGGTTSVTGAPAAPGAIANDVSVGGSVRHYGGIPPIGNLPHTEGKTLCRIE